MFTRTIDPNDKHIYYYCNECGEYLKVDELLWLHHQDDIIKYLKHTCTKLKNIDHQRYENYFKQFMDKYFPRFEQVENPINPFNRMNQSAQTSYSTRAFNSPTFYGSSTTAIPNYAKFKRF